MSRRIMEPDLVAFREYLIREEKSIVTVEKYMHDIRIFYHYAQNIPITKECIIGYKRHLSEAGYAVTSINSMLAAMNSFLSYKSWSDCRVKYIRQQKQTYCTSDTELTKEEYLRLLNAAGEGSRLQLVLQTLCATGIRISELKYFTVEALGAGEISVKCKSKTRIILVPGRLREKLLKYAQDHSISQGPVFITIRGNPLDRSFVWAQMKQLCIAANVDPHKVFPHNLRKLFARTFYSFDKDIAKLADVLGHENIETTRIYIKSSGSEHREKLEQLDLVI